MSICIYVAVNPGGGGKDGASSETDTLLHLLDRHPLGVILPGCVCVCVSCDEQKGPLVTLCSQPRNWPDCVIQQTGEGISGGP